MRARKIKDLALTHVGKLCFGHLAGKKTTALIPKVEAAVTVRQGQVEAFPRRGGAVATALALVLGMLVLAGCVSLPDAAMRTRAAESLATAAGRQAFVPAAAPLPVHGFARLGCPGAAISVYIEGDGLAWISVSMPSPDPTPLNPVALQLAALDPGCNVVYLGRPG